MQTTTQNDGQQVTQSSLSVTVGSPSEKIVGTGFYRDAKPGTFGPNEWLDLLMACQDGRATCLRVMEIMEREAELLANNPDEPTPEQRGQPARCSLAGWLGLYR